MGGLGSGRFGPRPFEPKPVSKESIPDPRFNAPLPVGGGIGLGRGVAANLKFPVRPAEIGNALVKNTPLDELYDSLARYINDPLGFVLWAFPWGEPGTSMEEMSGPEPWQREQLQRIGQRLAEGGAEGAVIEEDTSAGHGVGKSALVSWLILWGISTHTDTRGVVTANTDTQLRTKTWAELGKWYQLFIARQLFTLTATAIYIAGDKEREKTWRIDQIPWSKERSEAFAGLHNQGKRLLVIFDEACHDDKTEVLTKAGWKRFEDVTDLDEMLTMDPRTGVAEYRKPTKLFKAHRTGKMLAYEGRGASIKVTPNHKMWRRSPDGKGGVTPWKLTEAQALSKADHYMVRHIDWVKDDESTFVLPGFVGARKEWPARSFAMDDWMRFLGWYCSEGHVTTRGGYAFAIGVTQKDPAVLAEITALCERLGFAPKVYNDCTTPQVRVHDRGLAEWLLQWGKSCLDKRVPDCVRHASARHARVFIDTFTRGDGYVRTGSRSILYTSSKPLADGLQEVALKAGAISVIRPRALAGKEIDFGTHTARSSVDGWVVSVQWERSALTWKTKHVKEVDYDGMVYCAEVPPHHLLFTRRDGYCVWSGNSAIDDVIWEVTEGALTDAKTQIIWCRYGNPTKTSGAFFKKCLAAGTPVLTRGGWKPIEAITPTDEVWDGVEWVEQGGAVKSGHLFTTAVFGVRMTPDHKVLTQEGWVDGQACEGLERAPVRLPDGYDVRWPAQTGRAVESGVRLRRDEADARQRYQEGCRPRARGVMRVRSEGPPTVARDVSPPALCGASRYGATVYAALAQSVEGLWRAWYSCLREVGGLQGLRCGYGGLVLAGVDAGPTRQRRGLRARQLPLGNPAGAAQQYPSEHFHRDPEGRDDVGAGSPGLRNPIQPHVGAAGGGLVPPTGVGDFRDVYDLINCGPRSRFVVAGDDGRALIVHNCTQPRRNTYTRVDSREVSFSNKKQIQAWVDEYGDDSDFVRVRVKGQFPRAGYANFISPELVMQARRRRLEAVIYQHHPKVLAVDPARFGDDFSVITLRQGLKVHWQVALSGFDGPDLASRIFEIVRKGGQMLKGDGVPPGNISCIVYDAIGNGADLDSALRRMVGLPPCIPVQWGQPAKDDKQYFNQRSECWGKMRDFLEHGQIPDDDDLANQLTSLDYGYDARFRIQLQSKKDLKKGGGKSPDKADSLSLSFVPELIDRKVTLAKVRPVQRRTVVWTR